jgi:hypothetical protein
MISLNEQSITQMPNNMNINHSVTFYDRMNICTGRSITFKIGSYANKQINALLVSNPVTVKIDAATSLKIVYKVNTSNGTTNDEFIIYNNPYYDRFVVVKLPDLANKKIISFDVSVYTNNIINEIYLMTETGIFFSITYIIIILLLLLVFFVSYYF